MTAAPNAIDLLDADHIAVHRLFQAYHELVRGNADARQRRALAEEICMELNIHAKLEEELFYPAAREALDEEELIDEAEDQHGWLRGFIAQVLGTPANDALHDARVAVLAEHVERHVRQEREQVFNRLQGSQLDLHALGRSLAVRRHELRAMADAAREDAALQAAGA